MRPSPPGITPAREVVVALVERAEPLLVGLALGIDAGDVRIDELKLRFRFLEEEREREKKTRVREKEGKNN